MKNIFSEFGDIVRTVKIENLTHVGLVWYSSFIGLKISFIVGLVLGVTSGLLSWISNNVIVAVTAFCNAERLETLMTLLKENGHRINCGFGVATGITVVMFILSAIVFIGVILADDSNDSYIFKD